MRDILRKAGQAIRNFDDAYVDKVNEVLPGPIKVPGMMIAGLPATYAAENVQTPQMRAMDIARNRGGPASPGQIQRQQAIETALFEGLRGVNVGVRYGIPITAAGMTLNALTSAFGGPADEPEPNTLTIQ